jgi:hypothetical protein
MDGVYVVSPQCMRPVAEMLRVTVRRRAGAAVSGRKGNEAAIAYQYLTGSRFRQHMHAIVVNEDEERRLVACSAGN